MIEKKYFLTIFSILFFSINSLAQGDGYVTKDGKRLFPIGSYYLPKEDGKLKTLADAGFNIVRCSTKEELDYAQLSGLMG